MIRKRSIAILFHESLNRNHISKFRIWHCAQVWKEQGIDVRILHGPKLIDADLIIPQIPLSEIPDEYHGLFDKVDSVVNRNVINVRKSHFSENLISLEDDYDGPVIVKTDANYGGISERRAIWSLPLHAQIMTRLSNLLRTLRKIAISGSFRKLAYSNTLNPKRYPIYPSKSELPKGVFNNRDLVVEKFLPEKVGPFYYLRCYVFFGNQALTVRLKSEAPIVKASAETRLEYTPVDDSIVAARETLGFDYGKFDYVMHDGKAVLLDINATPTFGRAYPRNQKARIAGQLAKGVSAWFPEIAL